ncbi:MAG: hypothetical protein AB1486_15955 [Planctomycetota bacterium]
MRTNLSRTLVVLVLAAGFLGVLDRSLQAQYSPVTVRWVNAETGSDSNNGSSPIQAWKTISHALTAMYGTPGTVIKVIGRLDNGTGEPIRHDTSLGESFPLVVGKGQRIEKDLIYSEGPVIIDVGRDGGADAIHFGDDGEATGSFSGLKDVWVYNAGSGYAGVLIHDTSTTGTSVDPKLSGVRFNRCDRGVYVNCQYYTVSPTIQDCVFYNSQDPWTDAGPFNLDAHILIFGTQDVTASPPISGCTIKGDANNGTVQAGIRMIASLGADVSPTISNTTITIGPVQLPAGSNKGIGRGIESNAQNASKTSFVVQDSTVDSCYVNGIDMFVSSSYEVATQPVIERSTITRNGRNYASPATETRGDTSLHYGKGHGIHAYVLNRGLLEPTIQDNSPAHSGQIAWNFWDGVHLSSGNYLWATDVATDTIIDAQVLRNSIENNGRYGMYNSANNGTAELYGLANSISHNTWAGVLNMSRNPMDDISDGGVSTALMTLHNNTIFGSEGTGESQFAGVINHRQYAYYWDDVQKWSSEAKLIEVHDTVAQNYKYGILNLDWAAQGNPGSYVQNTVSWYNRKAGVSGSKDIQGLTYTAGGQVSYSDFWEATAGTNGNRKDEPKFQDLATYDFHLYYAGTQPGQFSPLIDKATNAPITSPNPTTDFEGEDRRYDIPGITNAGANAYADMGADEVIPD